MKRIHIMGSAAACICFGLGAVPVSAQTPVTTAPALTAPAQTDAVPTIQPAIAAAAAPAIPPGTPAVACLKDVHAFNTQMQTEGYWLGGAGNAYGYPMGGYGFGYGPVGGGPAGRALGYGDARPGYEIRTLMSSANILAQNGQQAACEDVLATTRTIYSTYAAEMHDRGLRTADGPGWEQQQINAALPVSGQTAAFRSDQLLDTDVRSMTDASLGSVHDLVLDPQSGKIAYLIVSRGGVFGIGESYVPVPWDDFRTTTNASLFVLDTTKAVMNAAPTVGDDAFSHSGQFDQQRQTVDAYWKAHLPVIAGG
jgi:sporulation protein YlmC with PRC-barrel domain